ncbi:hypothetical protein [Burkholderia vietnamiensis]|uniref:hypothetical protein n=1 Tax=Burkholderia vietnamiensis TaxID=60552 RepID=UPI0012DB7097|nr:hypothetical protein [Burkholderia vietnamiensis]
MKNSLLIHLISAVVLSAGVFPTSGFASTIDEQFACKSNAHTFIANLINSHLIDPTPIRVEANSVNAFRPTHGTNLTVYGLRVRAVFGYQPVDPTFRHGNGKTSSSPIYGAVVFGSSESVEAQLRQAGSTAVVQQVIPMMLSAIVCET